MVAKVTCYIPAFNSAATIRQVVQSVKNQTYPVDELLVIDDCSTDNTAQLAQEEGATVIKQPENRGRGACRAVAFETARNELVLACDSTIILPPDLLQCAVNLISLKQAAFVCAMVVQPAAKNAVERWRGRHLYKVDSQERPSDACGSMHQGVALGKKSAVLSVGNYAKHLRYWEDAELACKLNNAGHEIFFDPSLPHCVSLHADSLRHVFERLWRWSSHDLSSITLRSYLRQVAYWSKHGASKDVAAGDYLSALLTLLYPHYWGWKSLRYLKQCRQDPDTYPLPPNAQ